MNELIKIQSEVVGTRTIDSVKARMLHKALGITKDFTNWIKTQISRARLQINIDYIIIDIKSNGRPQKEYILSTESAKHISMMSQGKKAEAVRDYFIKVEEEYRLLIQNPNIHELSGRVGGLTTQNNKLRREVKKLKKGMGRVDVLESDVDTLKFQQKMLPHKNLDEKLEVLFQRSDILANEKTDCFWQTALQNHNRFYHEYIQILKTDGTKLQQWAINDREKVRKELNKKSQELVYANHKYEILLKKVENLQISAKKIIEFDIEKEMSFVEIL